MIYIFDLDGTLCSEEIDYLDAQPIPERIDEVNRLYEMGHIIIIDTARGTQTNIDWSERTEKQLKEWGVKYNTLRTGVKFYGNFYIDDHGIPDTEFFE